MKLFTAAFAIVLIFSKPISAQWVQTNGPFGGGAVTNIVADSAGILYASTGWSGYFRSTDNGLNWTPINNGLVWPAGEIVVSPDGILFASDQEIIRSFDQGETWEPCDNGLGRNPGSMAFNSSGHLYVVTGDGTDGPAALYVTEDNGDSWSQIPVPFASYMETVVIGINSMDHLFIGGPATLLRSTDNGNTWTDISPEEGYANIMTLCFDSLDIVYAGSRSGEGLFKSHDNGDLWTHLLNENVWCVNAAGDLVYVATGLGMMRSTDGGMSWDTVSNGLPPEAVYSTLIVQNGDVLAGTRGLYRSPDNGDNWYFSSAGMIASDVHQVIINNEGVVFSLSDKIWRSVDDGDNWENIGETLEIFQVIELETDNAGHLYLLGNPYDTRLYVSTDDGDNWTELILPDESFNDLDIHPSGDLFAASSYNGGLYKSEDGGLTWILAGFQNVHLQSVYIDPQGIILACEQNNPATVYRSADNGNTWSPVYTIEIYGSAGVSDYAHDGLGYLYMATYNELLRSEDEGQSWETITSSMSISSITANQYDTLYATTWDGIWQSPDQGVTWNAFNEGLPSWGQPETIAFSPADGILFAGWHGQGVWSYGDHSVDVNQPFFVDSEKLKLQLFPNPAAGFVNVRLNGAPPEIPLLLYSPEGRLITTIDAAAGSADISTLKKGLYFIKAGTYSGKLMINR